MSSCPTCGRAPMPDAGSGSNQEAEILLRVPERHFALFRKLFHEMEMKLGMYGYGELANALKPYGDPFRQDFEIFRYFDDGALAMVMTGVTRGYPADLRFTVPKGLWADRPDRQEVHVYFTFPDGSRRGIKVSDGAPPEPLAKFQAWFDDAKARLAPLPSQPIFQNGPSGETR